MASRTIVLGSEEISANETASTLDGCSLFCMENPEGWTFQSDSRGAAELKFTVRVRGDSDSELETNLAALKAVLRYIVGIEIKLTARTGNVRYELPLTNWPSFYGRYEYRDGGEDGAVLVDCVMTCDAIGDGTDPGSTGQIGVTNWTIHLASGGLVTAQGQAVFSGLSSATDWIKALRAGSATLPSWMGTAYKFFDAQLDVREGSFGAGVGVPVHVEMRQKQDGPTGAAFANVRDWEYSLARADAPPFVALEGAPVGKPPKLTNLAGSFQFRTQSAPDLLSSDTPEVDPVDIFREADRALDALIVWIQTAQATVIEVPGARRLIPSFPNSQVAFETVLMIMGGPNDAKVTRWVESLTFTPDTDLRLIQTYKGRRRRARTAGMGVTVSHKFFVESIEAQPYLTPIAPPGTWAFQGGKIPKPARNSGNGPRATWVTDGETTWARVSASETDIVPVISDLDTTRRAITEQDFG